MKQTQALAVMLSGSSLFLTGPPGSGKTYILNEFIRRSKKSAKHVAVTASTGIAATHIGGSTIHSWSGLGIRESLSDNDKSWLRKNSALKKRYISTDILVIDEISMLHGKRLDMIDQAAKLLRENGKPFGNMQVVLVGDLFQLPPISRNGEVTDFAYTSAAWRDLNPKICYLTEQHRQQNDRLLDILEAMRRGEIEDWHTDALNERLGVLPDQTIEVTKLFSHNIDVEAINNRHLARLDGKPSVYTMDTKGNAGKVEQLVRGVLAPESLELKVGAEVMFVANNFTEGYVNGSRGQIVDFNDDDLPVVKLSSNGKIIFVEKHSWSLVEDDKKKAEVVQLPLRLAWAITIHKSQGMSLDAAEIDLGKSFTPGMGYVALSRIRSLDGIYLAGINRMAMQLHPDIFVFDEQLRAASDLLAEQTSEVISEFIEPDAPVLDNDLFTRLKQWRSTVARDKGLPAYIIAHDDSLEAVAVRLPMTPDQLLGVPGFGPKKVESYGPDILKIVADHSPKN